MVDPETGECVEHFTDTHEANGNTFDLEGRIVQVQHKGRAVVRYETDGRVTTLADRYEGKRLNSPNDVVVDALGRIWFTDPRYGDQADLKQGGFHVYRLAPGKAEPVRVIDDLARQAEIVACHQLCQGLRRRPH